MGLRTVQREALCTDNDDFWQQIASFGVVELPHENKHLDEQGQQTSHCDLGKGGSGQGNQAELGVLDKFVEVA